MDDGKSLTPTEESNFKKVINNPLVKGIQVGAGLGLLYVSLRYSKSTWLCAKECIKCMSSSKIGESAVIDSFFGMTFMGTTAIYGLIAGVSGVSGGYNTYKGVSYFYNKYRKQLSYLSNNKK